MKNPIFTIILPAFLFLSGLYFTAAAQEKMLTYPYDASYEIADRTIELIHLDANLSIKPFDTLVQGKVEFTFRSLGETLDSIVFSVPEIKIREV